VAALRDAELIETELNPAYPVHSDAELLRAARQHIEAGRDPRELLAERLREKAKDDSS